MDPLLRHNTASRAGGRPGFTLIELLTVMFILAIVVALVVAVGSKVIDEANRKETIAWQKTVMAALNAYYEVYKTEVEDPAAAYPPDATGSSDLKQYLTAYHSEEAYKTMKDHPAVVAAAKILEKLPEDCFSTGGGFQDSWGREMRYRRAGGIGNKPVIISAGPDEEFGDQDADKAEDNIRSDEQM